MHHFPTDILNATATVLFLFLTLVNLSIQAQ